VANGVGRMFRRCPGIRSLIEPQIIIRRCPFCGEELEFFEHETQLECPKCGRMVHREPTKTCLSWCDHADKCIADLENRGVISRARAEELRKLIEKK